jgi:hypothetical protein
MHTSIQIPVVICNKRWATDHSIDLSTRDMSTKIVVTSVYERLGRGMKLRESM